MKAKYLRLQQLESLTHRDIYVNEWMSEQGAKGLSAPEACCYVKRSVSGVLRRIGELRIEHLCLVNVSIIERFEGHNSLSTPCVRQVH